jgi:hypothetical protein
MRLRLDVLNVFNRSQFATPDVDPYSPTFGKDSRANRREQPLPATAIAIRVLKPARETAAIGERFSGIECAAQLADDA